MFAKRVRLKKGDLLAAKFFSFLHTVYEDMNSRLGAQMNASMKLYMVPGMDYLDYHCSWLILSS